MNVFEWVLRKLSRKQDEPEYYTCATEKWKLNNALDYLCDAHTYFRKAIKGKDVLDFGCGPGWQSVAMAKEGAKSVVGVDVCDEWLKFANKISTQNKVSDKIALLNDASLLAGRQFDVVLSQDSFEHYSDPVATLQQMKSLLKPGGKLFLVFSGPWYSPWGSHMQVFTPLPWVNLLFPESVVMKVRADYRSDGATRYEDITSGLNKMTVARFYRIIRSSGMDIERHFYKGFKGMDFMYHIPIFRELFSEQLGCILVKPK